MSYVYYALAKCSVQLASFKTARICYEKLNQFKIPAEWSEEIDLQSLLVRSNHIQMMNRNYQSVGDARHTMLSLMQLKIIPLQ